MRTAFAELDDVALFDDFLNKPGAEPCVELWWGDPAKWDWSRERAELRVGYALSEAQSLLTTGREKAIENINKCDVLVCPSRFSARAYMESPVNVPIYIVPLGVDTDEMAYVDRDWKGRIDFLLAGAAQTRKGTALAIEAFLDAFSFVRRATLTIWSSVKTPELVQMQEEYGGQRRISFREDNVESAYEIYKDYHILISPHLSEGYGLCVPEAMSTGMPCLVARCSSPREYFSQRFGWWIEMSETYIPVDICLADTNGFWRLPDVNSIVTGMKDAYRYRERCAGIGKQSREYIKENYTWGLTASRLIGVIKEVLDGKAVGCYSCP
jgi:glycosyltransferase involved in cell wall biosynthesis